MNWSDKANQIADGILRKNKLDDAIKPLLVQAAIEGMKYECNIAVLKLEE